MDHIAALSLIVKMGTRTHKILLSDLAKEIWDYFLASRTVVTVEYLSGTLNVEANHQAQSVMDSSKLYLNPLIFKKICKVFMTADIYLFASRILYQILTYLAQKPNPFSKGTDVFQLSWISRDTLPPLLPHRKSFYESSSGKCHNNFNNSGIPW